MASIHHKKLSIKYIFPLRLRNINRKDFEVLILKLLPEST